MQETLSIYIFVVSEGYGAVIVFALKTVLNSASLGFCNEALFIALIGRGIYFFFWRA